jgi:hypothetical protein
MEFVLVRNIGHSKEALSLMEAINARFMNL